MSTRDPPVVYHPDQTYTFEEFELLNDWLKTNELIIDEESICYFELDSEGRLIPMPYTTYGKALVVARIAALLDRWNIWTRQHGVIIMGGFNLTAPGGERAIRAPNVAFTSRAAHDSLNEQQLWTYQGQPFHPTFVVEVEDVSTDPKLEKLTRKFKDDYFPAGIQLGWLVDPENKAIYEFKKDRCGVVQRHDYGWRDINGGTVLPMFELNVESIDQVISQESSESGSSDGDLEIDCPKCNSTFDSHYSFLEHFEDEHI